MFNNTLLPVTKAKKLSHSMVGLLCFSCLRYRQWLSYQQLQVFSNEVNEACFPVCNHLFTAHIGFRAQVLNFPLLRGVRAGWRPGPAVASALRRSAGAGPRRGRCARRLAFAQGHLSGRAFVAGRVGEAHHRQSAAAPPLFVEPRPRPNPVYFYEATALLFFLHRLTLYP